MSPQPRAPTASKLRLLLDQHQATRAAATVHVVLGAAGTVLPTLANRLHASLIVMGTVSRTGIRGLIIGYGNRPPS